MAYISQERKALIAERMKPVLKKYGIKATLRVDNHSTVILNVAKGPIDFIANSHEVAMERYGEDKYPCTDGYMQVNPYWYKDHFKGKALKFLEEAHAALKLDDWFDESDIQTDYFHVDYYMYVHIGRWNKPYQVI